MTRVYVYPADRGGCGYYRCLLPAQHLRAAGHDVTVFQPGDDGNLEVDILTTSSSRSTRLRWIPDCDVVVMQRPLHWTRLDVIPQLQRQGIRVVGEIDDDIRTVHPAHVAYHAMHPRWSPDSNWEICARALDACDRLVVSTAALQRRYNQHEAQPCVVVPNYLDPDFIVDGPLTLPVEPQEVVVGWPGRVASHPNDLDATRQAVGRVQRQLHFRFRVIGYGEGVKSGLQLQHEPEVHPWTPMDGYGAALSSLDVGIAPLGTHEFNQSKSWLKPLELAGRGVAFICSPTPEYLALNRQGAGLVALGRDEWMSDVRKLVESHDMRVTLAYAGLDVAKRYTIDQHIDEWERAWLLK